MATINQKAVFDRVAKKVGKGLVTSVSREMRGIYSPGVVRNPQKLTRSKGWKELMDKELPDGLLAKRHRELLNKREVVYIAGKQEKELIDQPDTQAVSKALDMAYKLKNKYPNENDPGNKTLIINISGETAIRYGIIPTPNTENSSFRPT